MTSSPVRPWYLSVSSVVCFFRRPARPAGSVQGPHRGGGSDPGHARPQQRPLPVMAALRGGAAVFGLLQRQHPAVCPRAHTHPIPAGTQHTPNPLAAHTSVN